MPREFKDFVRDRLNEGAPADDWFAQRMAQFQAASQGHKGAIQDDRTGPAKYVPPAYAPEATKEPPKQWVKMTDGWYEQMSPEDEADGLTTLSRWNNPSRTGSYYSQRKGDGRFVIIRPGKRLGAANRQSF